MIFGLLMQIVSGKNSNGQALVCPSCFLRVREKGRSVDPWTIYHAGLEIRLKGDGSNENMVD